MWPIPTGVTDAEIQRAWAVIRTIYRRCAAPLNGIDLHITGTQGFDAKVDGTGVVIIAIPIDLAAILDLLVNAGATVAPVNRAGVSFHAICIRYTVRTGPIDAHGIRATHGVGRTAIE